jgi:hypothetical protein
MCRRYTTDDANRTFAASAPEHGFRRRLRVHRLARMPPRSVPPASPPRSLSRSGRSVALGVDVEDEDDLLELAAAGFA